mgnify:CR=1 FL=1|jgi:ferrous iron transport protein A
MTSARSQPLPTIPPGQRVQVVSIAAGHRATRRLQDMGLIPGVEIRVLQSRGEGALMLAIGDSRLAVARGIAHKVLVQPVISCSPNYLRNAETQRRRDAEMQTEEQSNLCSSEQEVSVWPTV